MKRFAFFGICMLLTISMQAQVSVVVTPKVRTFPTSGLAYTDDPLKYFNVIVSNTSGQTQQVYFAFDIHCDYSNDGKTFGLSTPNNRPPAQAFTLSAGETHQFTRTDADRVFGHLKGSDISLSGISWEEALLLPEGNYEICVTPYKWQQQVSTPVAAGEPYCCRFTICYTGSAPEFTAPIIGQSAMNLTNTSPIGRAKKTKINASSLRQTQPTSNIQNSSQYTVITPTRNLTFRWTGVISNCLSTNDFIYVLKMVEVYPNQNVQTAINQNATIATIRNGSKLYYTHDTLNNRHFRLQLGHTYAALIEATPRNANITAKLGNNGKSQIITFTWGEVTENENVVAETKVSTSTSTSDNKEQVKAQLRPAYLVNPGKDTVSIAANKGKFAGEAAFVPNSSKKYTLKENTYYAIPDKDSLCFGWVPMRGDSIQKVSYQLELFEYVGGDVSLSYAGKALKSKTIEQIGVSHLPNDNSLLSFYDPSWQKDLESGYQYVARLISSVDYSYAHIITSTRTETTNGETNKTSKDSIISKVSSETFTSQIIFQWGIDSGALKQVSPPQFVYPVNMTEKDPEDTTWNEIKEIIKYSDFKFSWEKAKNVSALDSVKYHLLVAKLPKGKKREVAIKDTLFFYPNLTGTEKVDTLFKDSLKVGEQYVAYLDMTVSDTTKYLLLNKGRSQYITFKLLQEEDFVAKLDSLYQCSPKALEKVEKDLDTTLDVNDLIKNKTRLKLGEFPLVLQHATYCKEKKTFSGEGYIVWKPFAGECWLKVKVDSIQINKNKEIVSGHAISSNSDTVDYLAGLDFGLKLGDTNNDMLNRLTSELKNTEKVQSLLNKYGKYANPINGLLGPTRGETASTGVLSFPLRISDDMVNESHNFMLSINNMYFSPTTAIMNLLGIFHSEDENIYVPLVATNICMDPESFLNKADNGIYMFLGQNYDIDLTDGYKMRFKRSSTLGVPKDGTFILVDTGGFKEMSVQLEFELGEELLAINASSGIPEKRPVCASITANLASWSDWYGKITMDPFTVDGCETFTFVPTGKGIYYDHSKKRTPDCVSFPAGYFGEKVQTAKEKEEEKKKEEKMTDEEKKAAQKEKKEAAEKLKKNKEEWTGFYWDECTVFLSDDVSNTFVDTTGHDEATKDSMVIYQYGFNNILTDSSHYYYPGSRINFGAKGLIIDKDGFSCELFVRDIVKAETEKGGGWKFTLDTINLKFEKNKYKNGNIKGKLGLPLFSGDLAYNCAIAHDSLDFSITAVDTNLALDLWLATVAFDNKSSHFIIHKVYKEKDTKIDLTMNGKININFKELGLPVNFSLVKFEHMGMRNYNYQKDENKPQTDDEGKPIENSDKRSVTASGFEWDLGEWSWASPQKTMGGAASDGNGEVASGSFGGFNFSLQTLEPYFEMVGISKMKIGLAIAGKIGFGGLGGEESETFAIGAGAGFKIWGVCDLGNDFAISDVDGQLDSISLNTDLTVFHLKGNLYLFDDDPNYGDGFSGALSVSMMDKVNIDMLGGFGSSTKNGEKYNWWYLQGAAKFGGTGIPLGSVNLTGLGGGFAYNMDSKTSLTQFDAKKLLSNMSDKSVGGSMIKSTGMEFIPSKGSWVAKAGVSLAMANENLMNMDGYLTLRIANGHFSGIFLNVSAYALTKFNKDVPAGDGKNNSGALLKAQGIIGYERTNTYNYFRMSLGVSSDISLTNMITGGTQIPNFVDEISKAVNYGGAAITKVTGITLPTDKIFAETNNKKGDNQNNNFFDVKMSLYVPIDLEIMNYRKDTVKNGVKKKAGKTDWYFSIGKPNADECVRFELTKNLPVMMSSSAVFTMYLMTGNSFAYSLPPLDDEVQEFFFGKKDKEKDIQGANESKVAKARKISNTNMIAIKDGGGFVMGATFKAKMEYSMLLYVKIMASLGFDVALLDVGNTGCPGYAQIGKNDFYAMGRIYAMLAGSVGLRLNLGFWKGDIELLSAGIGALLQGGAPNPTWAYGLLKLKVSLLNGLCKINTSVDFEAGDVCIPGAGDPLANVKLFQSVSPGYPYEESKKKENVVSPFTQGTIVSNMPWDEDVVLVDGQEKNTKARRFRFVLWNPNIKYETYQNNAWKTSKMVFERSHNDENVYNFECEGGGFPSLMFNNIHLEARAFEWRTYNSKLRNSSTDYPYNLSTYTQKSSRSASTCDWYNPEFNESTDSKHSNYYWKEFRTDTTLYFKTEAKPSTLSNQVVYTWPYNGDAFFPMEEFPITVCPQDKQDHRTVFVYLNNNRSDILDPNTLSSQGKALRVFLVTEKGEVNQAGTECTYAYTGNASVPRIAVYIPKNYVFKDHQDYKIKFILINSEEYNKNKQAAQTESALANQQSVVQYKNELTRRNLEAEKQQYIDEKSSYTYKKVNGKWTKVKNTYQLSDIEKSQFEAANEYKKLYGNQKDTALLYKRAEINEFKLCNNAGTPIYTLYFSAMDGNYQSFISENANALNQWLEVDRNATSNTSLIKTKIKVSDKSSVRVNQFMTLFVPYEPEDVNLYASGITLPPIAYFIIDRSKSQQNNIALKRHHVMTKEFVDMDKAFKKTQYLDWFYGNKTPFNETRTWKDNKNHNTDGSKKVLAGGFIKTSDKFEGSSYRTAPKGCGNYSYESATYYPEYRDDDWSAPSIMTIYTIGNIPRVTEERFANQNYSSARNWASVFYMNDYATPATYNDIDKFYTFFQGCNQYAMWFTGRGYSHKWEYLRDFEKTGNYNKCLTFDEFPYKIPCLYIPTHFYQLSNKMVELYYTKTLKLKNTYSFPTDVSGYSMENYPWGRYWWHFDKLQYSDKDGIVRDIYGESNPKFKSNWYTVYGALTPMGYPSSQAVNTQQTIYLDIYYTGWDVKDNCYSNTPASSLFEEIAKKVKQKTEGVMIYKTNCFYDINYKWNYKLTQNQKTILDNSNRLHLYDRDSDFSF